MTNRHKKAAKTGSPKSFECTDRFLFPHAAPFSTHRKRVCCPGAACIVAGDLTHKVGGDAGNSVRCLNVPGAGYGSGNSKRKCGCKIGRRCAGKLSIVGNVCLPGSCIGTGVGARPVT